MKRGRIRGAGKLFAHVNVQRIIFAFTGAGVGDDEIIAPDRSDAGGIPIRIDSFGVKNIGALTVGNSANGKMAGCIGDVTRIVERGVLSREIDGVIFYENAAVRNGNAVVIDE